MQSLTIIGNLVKAPELRHTQEGIPVCSFTVAVNRTKTKNNQNPGADFFNVSAWRAQGENCAKYLDKGSKVCIIGVISLRTWEKGEKHGASLEVIADRVEFISTKSSETATSNPVDDNSGMDIVDPYGLPFD